MELEELLSGLSRAHGRRSRASDWYEDDRRLVGVGRPKPGARSLDLLAYGLQDLDGRTLELVVPAGAVPAIRAQAAWLTARICLYRFKSNPAGAVGRVLHPPQTALSRSEARRYFNRLGGLTPPVAFDASSWPVWLADLTSSLEGCDVERSETTRSVVWRYRGRQVLAVRPASSGALVLTAGADFTSTGSDRPAPFRRTVTAATTLTTSELDELRSTLDTTIQRRRNGDDRGHRERLLQARLSSNPGLIGLAHVRREVPAWRPKYRASRGRASIDLLGCDADRRGHVIEVKIRPEPQLGIQALDYWAWANARRAELAEAIGANPDRAFHLDLVLGGEAAESPLHPAAAATLQALVPKIKWRCHLISDWDTIEEPERQPPPRAETLPAGKLPG